MALINLLDCFDQCDIWRLNNTNKHMFTWCNRKNKIYCRLDYWFVVEHLANVGKQTNILPSIRSDHNITGTSLINVTSMIRGPGYWKFNTDLLGDTNDINLIKVVISKSEANNKYGDKSAMWELIKMDI